MKTPAWRFIAYTLAIPAGIAVVLLNFLPRDAVQALPAWFPERSVALCPDLPCGASLTLRTDASAQEAGMPADARADNAGTLSEAGIVARIANENETPVVRSREAARSQASLREAVEWVIPTFQRNIFGRPEPAHTMTEADQDGLRVALRDSAVEALQAKALTQSIESTRKRVEGSGVARLSIQPLGTDRILMQIPRATDPLPLGAPLGSTADLKFHRLAADPGVGLPLGANAHRLPMDRGSGAIVVEARFGPDGEVLTAPVVRAPVFGDSGGLSENFAAGETTTLSAMLRAGAPLIPLEESTVSADPAADAISGGFWEGSTGFAFVAFVLLFGAGDAVEAHFATEPEVSDIRTAARALGLGDVSIRRSDPVQSYPIWNEEQRGGESTQARAADQVRATVASEVTNGSFERVEIAGFPPAMPLGDLIDLPINKTLARSVHGSAKELVAIRPMAIWGGTSVQIFAIPMVFGIIIAAGSSAFIAAPILLLLLGVRRMSAGAAARIRPCNPDFNMRCPASFNRGANPKGPIHAPRRRTLLQPCLAGYHLRDLLL